MSNDNATLDDRVFQIATAVSAMQQGQADLHNRLFVEGGGVLPTMFKEITAIKEGLPKKADAATVIELEKTVAKIKEKHAYHLGFASGLGAAVTFIVKYGASKLGVHLP